MSTQTIIRANGSILAAVIATMVFGGIATFGLRIVTVAYSLDEMAPWVWAVLAVSLAFLWAVIHVLWGTFGVALIISRDGVRKPGPFRGVRLGADGLRIGRYDTVRSNFTATQGSSARMRVSEVSEIWALSPVRGAVQLLVTDRGAPEVDRITQAVEQHLGREVEEMPAQGRAGFDP